MWCRRNPIVAGSIAAVAAALIVGTAVSGIFAVRASNRARAERQERLRAENAENDAKKARDEIEGTLARSLIRPLDREGDGKSALSPTETEAFWELAEHGARSLGLRCLHEATRDPLGSRQLCARSEPALIAAVGLDEEKRRQAIELLMGRLADTRLPLAQKADIALTALELDDRSGSETVACEQTLAQGMKADLPEHLLSAWNTHLTQNVARLRPDMAARLLLVALERAPGSDLAEALATVSKRLAPADAAGVCNQAVRILAGTLRRETYDSVRWDLAGGFAATAVRAPPGAPLARSKTHWKAPPPKRRGGAWQ